MLQFHVTAKLAKALKIRPEEPPVPDGEKTLLHVFPALPASLAVEVGRVWMPKSDLSLRLYDNHRSHGLIPTFDIP